MPAAVLDQVGDRDELDPVLPAERDQIGDACHRSVVLHHLADHPGGDQTREPREIDGGLGVADALEHAAAARPQREDVAGLDEVTRALRRVDRDLHGVRAVVRGDSGGDPLARLDRDGERGPVGRFVVLGHHPQPELVAALLGQAEADEAAAFLRHEVDRFGRRELRRDGEVALVLAVGRVDDDDHLPLADVLDRVLDGRELAGDRAHRLMVEGGAARRTSRARRPRDSPCRRRRGRPASSP